MKRNNDTLKAMIDNYERVPDDMIEEFTEVTNAVFRDAYENADYEIYIYSYSQANNMDRVAALLWTVHHAIKLGFSDVMKEFVPSSFNIEEHEILCDIMMSLFMSWVKSKGEYEGDTIDLVTNSFPSICHWRILDMLGVECMFSHKLLLALNEGGTLFPLMSMYKTLYECIDTLPDMDVTNVYNTIISPNSELSDDEINTAMNIHKMLYDNMLMMAPDQLITWMMPDDENDTIHRLPESLLMPIYGFLITNITQAFSNETREAYSKAFRSGDISKIDPMLTGALSKASDEAIDGYIEDKKSTELYRKLRDMVISDIMDEVKSEE